MAQRHLDRDDNFSGRPWPVSPYVYPLTSTRPSPWPAVARVVVFGGIMLAGLVALVIGVVSYL